MQITLIADGILIATCLTTAIYCVVLSRRLRRLSNTDDGLGQQIIRLNATLDETKAAVAEMRATTKSASEELTRDIEAAKRQGSQLQQQIARAIKSGVGQRRSAGAAGAAEADAPVAQAAAKAAAKAAAVPATAPASIAAHRIESPDAEIEDAVPVHEANVADDDAVAAAAPSAESARSEDAGPDAVIDFDAAQAVGEEIEDHGEEYDAAPDDGMEEGPDDISKASDHWPFEDSDEPAEDLSAEDLNAEDLSADEEQDDAETGPAVPAGQPENGLLRVERMAL